jgi:hypothetical protein
LEWASCTADDVEVSTLPIAEFSSNGEHIAGIADAKARLVRETDGEIQRAILDSVSDEVHHLAMDFRIFPTQPPLPLLLRLIALSRSFALPQVPEIPDQGALSRQRSRVRVSSSPPISQYAALSERPVCPAATDNLLVVMALAVSAGL